MSQINWVTKYNLLLILQMFAETRVQSACGFLRIPRYWHLASRPGIAACTALTTEIPPLVIINNFDSGY